MRVVRVLIVLCAYCNLVNGVGFRYRADPRSGEKRLWLHVPGSSPNILTDFDEKPYFGPKNLIDANRPRETRKSQQQQRRPPSRPNSYPSDEDEGGYSRPRPPPPSNRPRPPPRGKDEDGYLYPRPDKAFQLPGEGPPRRPPVRTTTYRPLTSGRPSRPQVGYPDVPIEESFGIGQNSEENKDLLAGRPFRPTSQPEPGYTTSPPTRPPLQDPFTGPSGRPVPVGEGRPFRPKNPFDEPQRPPQDRFRPERPDRERIPPPRRPSERPEQLPPRRPSPNEINPYQPQRPSQRPDRFQPERPERPSDRPDRFRPEKGDRFRPEGGDRFRPERPTQLPDTFRPERPQRPERPSERPDRFRPSDRPSDRPDRFRPEEDRFQGGNRDRFRPERPSGDRFRPDRPSSAGEGDRRRGPDLSRPQGGIPGYPSEDEADREGSRRPSGNEANFGQGVPPRNSYSGGGTLQEEGFEISSFDRGQEGGSDTSRDRFSGGGNRGQSSRDNPRRPSQSPQQNRPQDSNKFSGNNQGFSSSSNREQSREFSSQGANRNRDRESSSRGPFGGGDRNFPARPREQDRRGSGSGGFVKEFESSQNTQSNRQFSSSSSASSSSNRNRVSGSGGGGSYGGADDSNDFNGNSNFLNNGDAVIAPDFGPQTTTMRNVPLRDGTNNKDMSECGKDGKDEFYSNRLGRCVSRNTASKGY